MPQTNRISELTARKIPELSEVLRECKQDYVAARSSMSRIPNLLSGSFQQTDRAEILAAIPSRNIVDTLISEAFVNTDNECSELSTASEIVPRLTFGSDSPPSDLSQGGKSPLRVLESVLIRRTVYAILG
jgi:hypothetical protein